MKATRPLVAALLVCAVALAVGCGEHLPTAPQPQSPQADLLGGTTELLSSSLQKHGLLKCSPLPYDSVTQVIGPEGGTLRVGPHALRVPANALQVPVTITGVIRVGKVNRVHFEPAGLAFKRSASLTMSYANCNTLGSLLPKRIAYVDDDLSILYYLLSLDNLLAKKVTGQVGHFSDYAVAW
ncbi:MAG: hypothetical protein ACREL9_09495 [Gemmatimonadales bacterium]